MTLRQIAWGACLGGSMMLGCWPRTTPDAQRQDSEPQSTATAPSDLRGCRSTVQVRVPYPGAGAEEVEAAVTLHLEDALADLEGLVRLESRSSEGEAQVRLEFSESTEANVVRSHLAAQLGDSLPSGVEEPLVTALSTRFERTPIEVRGDPSASSLVLDLLRNEGVEADIVGARSRFIRVRTDPKRLALLGLTQHQVRSAIVAIPPPQPPRIGAPPDAQSDPLSVLANLTIGLVGGGAPRLKDFATIEFATAPTPIVLDVSGEVGLLSAAESLPAVVASQLPAQLQVTSGNPVSAPRCHLEQLKGLGGVVAGRVDAIDTVAATKGILTELAVLDPDVIALVGLSDGLGLDLVSMDADVHLLFPTAPPKEVVERLRALPEVEPLRVWGPPSTRVSVFGLGAEQRDLALRALRSALEDAGFFALSPRVAAEPQLSFSLQPSAAAVGLTAPDVARQVRAMVTTEPLTRMRLRGADVPVVLEATSDTTDLTELANLYVETPDGGRIPLSTVATIELSQPPAYKWRVDRRPARELQTNAPRSAVLEAWARLATEHRGSELLVD